MNKKIKPISFWKPISHTTKFPTKLSFKPLVRPLPKRRDNFRFGMPSQLFADYDKDGVANVFDCKPRNPRKQDSYMLRQEIAQEIKGSDFSYGSPLRRKRIQEARRLAREGLKEFNEEHKELARTYRREGRRTLDNREVKHTYPYYRKGTVKVVTKADVIKTIAKNPELIQEIRGMPIEMLPAKVALQRGVAGDYGPQRIPERIPVHQFEEWQNNPSNQRIRISEVVPIKQNLLHTIKHELGHHQQRKTLVEVDDESTKNYYRIVHPEKTIPKEQLFEKLEREEQKIINQRNKETDDFVPTPTHQLKWKERPIEIDAERRANEPTERQLARKEGPQPEALQALDNVKEQKEEETPKDD